MTGERWATAVWAGVLLTAVWGLARVARAETVPPAGGAAPVVKAVTPDDRLKEGWWQSRHETRLSATNRASAKLVFIGDSITQGFEGGGKAVWAKYYAPRNALNLGYSGDRTEHVLWRLDHGEVDGTAPRLAVVMLGTNNTGHRMDKPEDIAAGMRLVLERLRAKLPETKVLVLAIFPRGEPATDRMRVNNDQANALIAKLADNERVFFLDLNKSMLDADGKLPRDIMPDLLHPNGKGYTLWAESMEPTLAKLLGDTAR